eukprot:5209018-Prymnesium_polylepis.1
MAALESKLLANYLSGSTSRHVESCGISMSSSASSAKSGALQDCRCRTTRQSLASRVRAH